MNQELKMKWHSIYGQILFEVKRVYIPKSNGKKRPLGIPVIKDRIVQQSIVNVLSPLCEELVFHKWSCGYRPNLIEKYIERQSKKVKNKRDKYIAKLKARGQEYYTPDLLKKIATIKRFATA